MAVEVRPTGDEELSAFTDVLMAAFGDTANDDVLEEFRRNLKFVERIGAYEDGSLIGSAGSFPSDLTLPGPATLPVSAVTYVGVLPTHRRRGILRQLMNHQLADFHDRGEPIAVLTASEGPIYGRFGYGPATFATSYQIRRDGRRLRDDPGSHPMRLVPLSESAEVVAAIYERYRVSQCGELRRSPEWWDVHLRPAKASTNERRFVAVHTGPGGDDAYCIYQVEPRWDASIPRHRLTVESLVALSSEAQAGIISYLLGVDLVDSVTFKCRPVDDHLRWLLADSRRLEAVFSADWLWVRPIDVPQVMAGRRYRIDGHLGIEVRDGLCPWNSGRWWVEGGEDGASCVPAGPGRQVELTMGPAELGSILLGGVHCTSLARAGLIEERRPGGAANADTFLGSNEAPFCSTAF